jgi:hypothetical protein
VLLDSRLLDAGDRLPEVPGGNATGKELVQLAESSSRRLHRGQKRFYNDNGLTSGIRNQAPRQDRKEVPAQKKPDLTPQFAPVVSSMIGTVPASESGSDEKYVTATSSRILS